MDQYPLTFHVSRPGRLTCEQLELTFEEGVHVNIPGAHASSIYLPFGCSTVLLGRSSSNPVPPPGSRTNRLVIGLVRWEPGRKDKAPFSGVHFSKAIQKPRAVGGFVY